MVKHLACMMDGNRRFARRQGWFPWLGHKEGTQTVKRVVEFCLEKGISYLSLYTLSLENLKRPKEEIDYILDLMINEADDMIKNCGEKGVRIRFIGDRSSFPAKVVPVIERIEKETVHLNNLHLNFLFCYGARQEIVEGIKKIINDVKTGNLSEDKLSDELFSQYLWTSGMPEPDLVLRTGGVVRMSNFLLYQAAYAEYYFLDCLWPELTKNHLEKAMLYFHGCQRNFGT